MDNSVYVSLSKQTAVENQLDMVANNLANANTTGFKSEDMAFTSYMQKSDGGKTAYAKQAGTVRDNSQGPLQTTGNPLDLAIQGPGYFAVQANDGSERYTRAGNFMLDANDFLTTSEGNPVLDTAGQKIQFQQQDQNITVFEDGRIQVDGNDRAQIGIFSAGAAGSMSKAEGNLYTSKESPTLVANPRVTQGMLENSNVNQIQEMTKLIALQRSYERSSNFVNSIYDLQSTAISTLGKTD